MYCSTCELEIKGDDKDTCPVCGGALSDSRGDDGSLVGREQTAAEGIFKNADSPGDPEPSSVGFGPDEIFVLKDYASDALEEDSSAVPSGTIEEPALFAQPGAQDSDEPPLMNKPEQGGAPDMDDILDSIRESIANPVNADSESAAGGSAPDSLDVDFGSFDSFDQDASSAALIEDNAEESADISWNYDEAASAIPVQEPPQRRRSPALAIILILVLIAGGGYYVFMTRSGDQAPPINEPVEVIVSAEPVLEENLEIAGLAADAQPEEPAVPDGDAGVASVEPDSAGETGTSGLTARSGAEELIAPGAAEFAASAEEAVSGAGEVAMASDEADTQAPVEPAQAEAVVAGDGETVNASASTEPEAAAAPEKTQDAAPAMPEPVKAPFFTVHVGSYQKRVSASSEVARIKAKGYDAFVERVDLGKKGIWYRVKVGRFKNRAEAEKLQKKIEKVLVTDSMVVTQRTN